MLKKRNRFGFMVSLHRLFVAIAPCPYRERITADKRLRYASQNFAYG